MYRYKLAGAMATGALILQLLSPAAYAAELEISGNGKGSNNTINVTQSNECTIKQKSNTTVGAVVVASADTGNNTANGNTGGNVTINTGNANATANMTVTGGSNTIDGDACCCQPLETSNATISGNGKWSNNTINETQTQNTTKKQKTNTTVSALVGAKAKTGKNKANGNTNGTVNVSTGNANATANLTVTGGSNTLNVTP